MSRRDGDAGTSGQMSVLNTRLNRACPSLMATMEDMISATSQALSGCQCRIQPGRILMLLGTIRITGNPTVTGNTM